MKLAWTGKKDNPSDLTRLEQQLEDERRRLAEAISREEAAAGEALLAAALDGKDFTPVVAGPAQQKLAAIRFAIRGTRQRRIEALEGELRAEAAAIGEQARRQETELASLRKQAETLLAKLAVLEEVPADSLKELTLWGSHRPKSEKLRASLSDLYESERSCAARKVKAEGRIQAKTTAELIQALYSDPKVMAPSAETVEEWIGRCELALRTNPDRALYADRPRVYFLVWDAGEIDPVESMVEVEGVGNYASQRP